MASHRSIFVLLALTCWVSWPASAAGLLTDADLAFMKASNYPGNLPADLTDVIVSPGPGGFFPQGYDTICEGGSNPGAGCASAADCLGGSCSAVNTSADATLPLASLAAAGKHVDTIGGGCGNRVKLDAGDEWRNESISLGLQSGASCEDNDEYAIVVGPWPEEQHLEIEFIWEDSTGAAVAGTATSGTATTLNDTSRNWQTNELLGGEIFIMAQRGDGPAFRERRRITGNTATQVSILQPFSAPPDTGTDYRVTPLAPPDGGNGEFFGLRLGDRGIGIWYGMTLIGVTSEDAASCSAKSPANPCGFWHVWVDDFLGSYAGFHLNEPTTDYLIFSGCRDGMTRCVHTSGNFVGLGFAAQMHENHDAGDFAIEVKGHHALCVDCEVENLNPDVPDDFKLFIKKPPSAPTSIPSPNLWYDFRSKYTGAGGIGGGLSWECRAGNSCSGGVLHHEGVSVRDTAMPFSTGFDNEDDVFKLIRMRNGDLSATDAGLMVGCFSCEEVIWDVRSTQTTGGSSQPFDVGEIPRTLAGARVDIENVVPNALCYGDCSDAFFGLTQGPAPIDVTVPDPLCLPEWALPGGRTACRFALDEDAPSVPSASTVALVALTLLLVGMGCRRLGATSSPMRRHR